jgi:hypothetical protein
MLLIQRYDALFHIIVREQLAFERGDVASYADNMIRHTDNRGTKHSAGLLPGRVKLADENRYTVNPAQMVIAQKFFVDNRK